MTIKKLFLIASMVILSIASVFAQAPQGFTYQAVVRDANGKLITNAPIGVRMTILQGSSTGREVYSDEFRPYTNANGLFSIVIGNGMNSINVIDWAKGPYFLKSEIDPDGARNYTLNTVQQMLSVPYALYAQTAGNVSGGINYDSIINKPTNISYFTNDAGYLTTYTETQVLSISRDTLFLTGGSYVVLPASFTGNYNDLINKPNLFSGNYNDLSNKPNLFTGNYNDLTNKPTIPTVPTNVSAFSNDAGYLTSYTEAQVLSDVVSLGNMANNQIKSLTDPTDPMDAVNLRTVNSLITSNMTTIINRYDSIINNLNRVIDTMRQNSGFAVLPNLTTIAASNITSSSVVCGGNITSDGGSTIVARGVCWSTSQNPTINDNHTLDGIGSGSYTSTITGLLDSTTYYVRAYATNSAGIAYGSQVSFTTIANASIATLTTTTISSITNTTATSGGNITSDGGAMVTARGVCWSTSKNPTINDNYTIDGTGGGIFTSNITGLTAGATYYLRAYATNSVGTAYGNEVSFTATANAILPTVTTSNLSNLTFTEATLGGNVSAYGSSAVTARGICWSTSPNPTINDKHTNNGIGTGSFTSSITGLTAGTTYYVRAYATNSDGTAYGNQITLSLSSINNATNAYFSVSAANKVYFSPGNLQWSAKNGGSTATTHAVMGGGTAAGTWRFAPNQGVTIGSDNAKISSTYSNWIDLFGWGTSGYNSKYPYMTSTTNYGTGTTYGNGTNDISGTCYDWGLYNAIYNPYTNTTDVPGIWRTLTKDEWVYLMNTRSTSSGVRYAKACVMGTNGLIIVPDNWSKSIYTLDSVNRASATYTSNTINATNWTNMENAGCVFLPAAGGRGGTSVNFVGSFGIYWSATCNSSYDAYDLSFGSSSLNPSSNSDRYYNGDRYGRDGGQSVRLVRSAQ